MLLKICAFYTVDINYDKLSIKDVRNQGGRPLFGASRKEEAVLQMRTSTVFGAKTLDFSKFEVYPRGQGGVRTFFFGQEKVTNFSRFCVDAMDGP